MGASIGPHEHGPFDKSGPLWVLALAFVSLVLVTTTIIAVGWFWIYLLPHVPTVPLETWICAPAS